MSVQCVRMDADRQIATVTLDRVGVGNAIDERMASELREVCERIGRDDEIRVVVITGEGDTFCAGTDPLAMETAAHWAEAVRALRVASSIAAIEKPVIAAINGDAVDQGLELALACDLRIASSRSMFALTHLRSGLIPWDGGTQRLPRLIGLGRAMEMILTCRSTDAQEALDMGMVTQVVEPERVLGCAKEAASTIAGHGPIAARYLKEAMLKGLDMTVEQGLRLEADMNIILQSTADRAEGVRSFLERRTPEYRGE